MRRLVPAFVLFALVMGCSNAKAPAQAALTAAETAVGTIQGEAMKVMPDMAKGLSDSLASAKTAFDAGSYAASMATAKAIPDGVKALGDSVTARKAAFQSEWAAMSTEVPKQIQSLTARVAEITRTKKMPAGLDAAGLAEAKTAVAALGDEFKAVGAMVQGGQVADAMEKAGELKTAIGGLMSKLGMSADAMAKK